MQLQIRRRISQIGLISQIAFIGLVCLIGLIGGAKTASASIIPKAPNNLGLVGYWSFDDNGGDKATDFSGNGNTGTLTNMEMTDWVAGRRGKALTFDGVNEYVTVTTDVAPLKITGALTLSAWFKRPTAGVDTFVGKWEGTTNQRGYYIEIYTDNKIYAGVSSDGTGSTYFQSSGTYTDTGWHLITLVYDTSAITAYLDGATFAGSLVGGPVPGSIYNSTTPFRIGIYNSVYSSGLIDEVRVYNRALSATEVSDLYGQSSKISKVSGLPTSGLVGYWPFDADDVSGTTVYDRSGRGPNGTLTNGASTTSGMIGNAASFDGSNDYITMGAAPALDFTKAFTLSAWYYHTGNKETAIMSKFTGEYPGYMLWRQPNSDVIMFYINTGVRATSRTLTRDAWYYITATWDGVTARIYTNGVLDNSGAYATAPSSVGGTFYIGSYLGSYTMNGKVDEARVYDRALSSSEIMALYNQRSNSPLFLKVNTSQNTIAKSNLVGWWTFDGNKLTTTTSTDSSGQGNNGTLNGGPVPALGKIGQALKFDGTDDYVTAGSMSSVFNGAPTITMSGWLKRSASNSFVFISKTTDSNNRINIGFWNDGNLYFNVSNAGLSYGYITLNDTNWHHVVMVFDGSQTGNDRIKGYVDGVAQALSYSGTSPATLGNYSGNFEIGRVNMPPDTFYSTGSIDDVRIYNKALSAAEVLQLYNQGK